MAYVLSFGIAEKEKIAVESVTLVMLAGIITLHNVLFSNSMWKFS